MGKVAEIFISPSAGLPMISVPVVYAMEGVGLTDDRYALGKGAYSRSTREAIRHITLIAAEAIEEANEALARPFLHRETRRNIVTEGIVLDDLIGKIFSAGNVKMRGVELCEPCDRPSQICRKPGFEEAFRGLGGIRAEVLESGLIWVNNKIEVPE